MDGLHLLYDPPNQTRDFAPRPTDVFVAMMGMTGAGKSTFISLCTGQDAPVGHDLQACKMLFEYREFWSPLTQWWLAVKGTQEVEIYKFAWSSTVDVYLVDTPGFDDTNRSDSEVLQEIATWLANSYKEKIKLSGILYLHRIDNPRMQGSARKNLFMFKKLCGSDILSNIILVSTMWETLLDNTDGVRREQELVATEDFWGYLVGKGARVRQHNNTLESAHGLLKLFIKANKVTMAIQTEMVTEQKRLDETQAGQEVQAELKHATEKLERELAETQKTLQEAIEARDRESAENLRLHKEEMNRKLDSITKEREQLKVSMEKMHRDIHAQLERRNKEIQKQKEQSDRLLEKSRKNEQDLGRRLEALQQHQQRSRSHTPTRVSSLGSVSTPILAHDWSLPGLHQLNNFMSLSLSGSYYFFVGPLQRYE